MRILVIQGDTDAARMIEDALRDHEVRVEVEADPRTARGAAVTAEGYDLVLCEFAADGLDALAARWRDVQKPMIAFISDYDHVVEAALIADAVLIKPFSSEDVRSLIAQIARARSPPSREAPDSGDACYES